MRHTKRCYYKNRGFNLKHYYRNIYSGQHRAKLEDLDKTIYPSWLKGKWREVNVIPKKKIIYHNMSKLKE